MRNVYLFVLALTLLNCSVDDTDNTEQDIVGKWQITSILSNDVEVSNDCSRLTNVNFMESGAYTAQKYDEGTLGCTLTEKNGKWEKVSTNVFSITMPEKTFNFQANVQDDTLEIIYTTGDNNDFRIVQKYERE